MKIPLPCLTLFLRPSSTRRWKSFHCYTSWWFTSKYHEYTSEVNNLNPPFLLSNHYRYSTYKTITFSIRTLFSHQWAIWLEDNILLINIKLLFLKPQWVWGSFLSTMYNIESCLPGILTAPKLSKWIEKTLAWEQSFVLHLHNKLNECQNLETQNFIFEWY